MLTNKSAVRKYGTYNKDGYLPQNDFGSRFSAIACRLFVVPMAHFGIESIVKKDGYPSQNDFALSPKGTD